MVLDSSMLFGAFARILSYPQRMFLDTPITDEEIQKTLFSLKDNKAPSPDGFNVRLFKKSWSIFCPDTINVIRSFFFSGWLLKQVNATTISLIIKFLNPSKVKDFRPISCCIPFTNALPSSSLIELKKYCWIWLGFSYLLLLRGEILSQEFLHNYHRTGGGILLDAL